MNLDSFIGPGSTPSRRRFWDKVTAAVNASQKIQGDNVSVEEHEGVGTLINVPFSNRGRLGPNQGACCDEFNDCTISTEEDCTGTFQGVGTVCDPNPCGEATTGACCATDGSGCVVTIEAECTGNFYGVGTTCDGFICAFNPGEDCHCALFAPFEDGLGGYWTRKDTDCFGAVTYSGATTAGTLYIDYALELECCSEGGTIYDCVQHSFLDYTDPEHPICNLFESDPCFVSPDPCFPGTGNTFGFEEVSHLVDDPCP